jgi:UDP-glucose 4-epimerase
MHTPPFGRLFDLSPICPTSTLRVTRILDESIVAAVARPLFLAQAQGLRFCLNVSRADGMTSILVTGGAGYVGSHACKELARAGYTPVVFDNLSHGHIELVKWGPIVRGDIRDSHVLMDALRIHRPSAVMHFAGLTSVEESVRNPLEYYDVNVRGTIVLLNAMFAHRVTKLVFSSSCCVYDSSLPPPFDEATPVAALNPYGHSKLMSEKIIADAASARGVSSVALRYFNACGADPEAETGEWHEPETHLIPKLLAAAAGNAAAFQIHGNDYATPDGTCVRDYVHVSDLATAHVLALEFLTGNHGPHIFNLGTGRGTSVMEVVSAAREVTGRNFPVVISRRRTGDASSLVADATRAAQILGWKAKRQSIVDNIEDAWRWHSIGQKKSRKEGNAPPKAAS